MDVEQKEVDKNKGLKNFIKNNLKMIVTLGLLTVFIIAITLFAGLINIPDQIITIIGYEFDLGLIILCLEFFLPLSGLYCLLLYFLPSLKASSTDCKKIIMFLILFVLGFLAGLTLVQLGAFYADLPILLVMPVSLLIVLVYDMLIYFLCLKNKMDDKHIFWEIIRFSLVGIIAAIFDFAVTSLIRFVAFKNVNLPDFLISTIAVTAGFTIGVIVNYLCSITLVFKDKTEKDISKKASGVVLFVVLGAVGLGIGIGLEFLFFDVLKWPEPVSFVIRTLVVLVWNYFSRKRFIFK